MTKQCRRDTLALLLILLELLGIVVCFAATAMDTRLPGRLQPFAVTAERGCAAAQ